MSEDQAASERRVPGLRLVLASGSPQRQDLLRRAGIDFLIDPADIDEDDRPAGLLPGDLAEYLAFRKAQTVAQRHPNDLVLGADTVVAFGDAAMSKPVDANDARRMLRLLGGTTHIVITGVALVRKAANVVRRARVLSAVQMRALTPREIDDYIATDQWRGKAGGYGIQDQDPFVVRTGGCHTNIVGLPMNRVRQMLADAGIAIPPS